MSQGISCASVRSIDDASPRVVPTWFIRRGDDIVFTPRTPAVFFAQPPSRPARRSRSIDEVSLPYRKVSVQGTARMLYEPGADDEWRDLYRAIACRYVPTDVAYTYIQSTHRSAACALIAIALSAARVHHVADAPSGRAPDRHLGTSVLRRRQATHGQPGGRRQVLTVTAHVTSSRGAIGRSWAGCLV